MAVKLSNSIPELLPCRISVVVCGLVMVRFISTPLFPERLCHDFLVFFLFEWKCKLALLLLPLIPTSRQKIGVSKFTHHLRVDCVEFYFGSSSWGTWGVEGDGWDDTSSSACEIDSSWGLERDRGERECEREYTWQQE